MNAVLSLIDRISAVVGRTVGWVIVFVMFIAVFDVLARRLFNAPVAWAFDVSVQLFALHFMLASAYAMLNNEHVSINIFTNRLSVRARAIVDMFTMAVLFFPFVIVLIIYGWEFAERSWAVRETSWGIVALPLYYIKTVIPITGVLLLLQGFASFVRRFRIARTGVEA
ncbi:TRAP transporter small permease subunit [Sedimentitalea nanhaiensis]|uniref:TRAP transporter small permease protein n=1 Tax=Sedimentitalea nanhaiensis TaxID=999627 RepID=A0A1I7DFY6_9RHOB|nr:TRAP transporter small permease subunit [Sedimentitalea nanhaiensis]SFU10505.1 TRAP-type mannitol/chloroaromatic compound transport system, small permease component [Sedimentitalea nanhaiensis]